MTDNAEESRQNTARQSLPASNESSRGNPLVVGVGASAGGLEALKAFFGELKPGCGIAFVVITHQHTERENLLPGLLDAATELTVVKLE